MVIHKKNQLSYLDIILDTYFLFSMRSVCFRDEIIEFCDPRIQSIKNTVEEMFDIKIKNHSLYFFGEKNNK